MTNEEIFELFKKFKEDRAKLTLELEHLSTQDLKEICSNWGVSIKSDKSLTLSALIRRLEKEVKKGEGKMELKIDQRLKELVPRPSKEDFERLTNSIRENGLLEQIKALKDGTILDGYSRFQVLTDLKIPITEEMVEIIDIAPDQIDSFVYCENIARRHLSDLSKIELVKRLEAKIKEEVKKEKTEKIKKTKAIKEGKVPPPKKEKEEKRDGKKEKPPIKKRGETAREKVAKAAGISDSQKKQYDMVEKYAPQVLEEARKADKEGKEVKVGTLYMQVKEKLAWIEKMMRIHKEAKEAHERIKENPSTLYAEYEALKALNLTIEKPKGPITEALNQVVDIFWNVMLKKYKQQEIKNCKLEKEESELISRITALCDRYEKDGK